MVTRDKFDKVASYFEYLCGNDLEFCGMLAMGAGLSIEEAAMMLVDATVTFESYRMAAIMYWWVLIMRNTDSYRNMVKH